MRIFKFLVFFCDCTCWFVLEVVGNAEVRFTSDAAHLNHVMRKPTFCICDDKGADQLCSICEADHHLFFATQMVQFLYFLNPKFPAFGRLWYLYSSVCVGPVQNHIAGFLMTWHIYLQATHPSWLRAIHSYKTRSSTKLTPLLRSKVSFKVKGQINKFRYKQ